MERTESGEFYFDKIYLCVYIVLWGVLIDISLYFVLKRKNLKDYLIIHKTMNVWIILTGLANNLILINKYQLRISHLFLIFEMLCFFLEIVQFSSSTFLQT